jgi:hypothetical protein
MIGEFDTSVGGISGSTLDAASFLDTYSSDNRSGFTINWGFDSSLVDVEVIYYDIDGNRHREMWAYDAICSALNGEIFLVDGAEAVVPAAKDIDVTPTTVSFTVDQFENAAYNNITYTMQYYSLADDVYIDVDGKVDVPVTAADVVVEGLLPFYYGYDATGGVNYQGDYQIVIEFGYELDATKEGQTISNWFEMDALLEADATPALNSAAIDVTLSVEDKADRTVSTMVLYTEEMITAAVVDDPATTDVDETAAAVYGYVAQTNVVDFADLSAVSVSGLEPSTHYVIEVTTSDSVVSWISFSTEDLVVIGDITPTDLASGEFAVTPDDEATGLVVDSIKVYSYEEVTAAVVDDPATTDVDETAAAVMDWVEVSGATVDMSDLTKVSITGLAEKTEYKVVVAYTYMTVSDEVSAKFTTEATATE